MLKYDYVILENKYLSHVFQELVASIIAFNIKVLHYMKVMFYNILSIDEITFGRDIIKYLIILLTILQ